MVFAIEHPIPLTLKMAEKARESWENRWCEKPFKLRRAPCKTSMFWYAYQTNLWVTLPRLKQRTTLYHKLCMMSFRLITCCNCALNQGWRNRSCRPGSCRTNNLPAMKLQQRMISQPDKNYNIFFKFNIILLLIVYNYHFAICYLLLSA